MEAESVSSELVSSDCSAFDPPAETLQVTGSRETTSRRLLGQTYLCGLVHLGDHGVDHVVCVADERPSVAVPPLLAVHGFPLSEHEVEVGHEAGAEHRHNIKTAAW